MTFEDWRTQARSVPIGRVLSARGIKLRGNAKEACGPCPKCGGKDRFSVNHTKQVWNCRGCDLGGDVIGLVEMLDACDFIAACENLTGLPCPTGKDAKPVDPQRQAELEQQRERYNKEQQQREYLDRVDVKRKGELAGWLWERREEITETCAVGVYLRKRGYTAVFPSTLGYLPPNDRQPPAMIAAFCLPDQGAPVRAVHITRLLPDGTDRERSDKGKIIIGKPKGMPIVLAPPNDLLALNVCEGIENGLKYFLRRGGGVWVAGAAGLLPTLAPVVPTYTECVNIFADPDQVGIKKGQELARALRSRKDLDVEINLKRIGSVDA